MSLTLSAAEAPPDKIALTPFEAAQRATLPEGFRVSVFAAEPEVVQPVAMNFDDRGRLWVVEMLTYADLKVNFDLQEHDRIVVLEDTDHDGHMDKRTVFWEGGQRVTSVEIGFGGVWVLAAPQMLFIPDRNGDDVPDGAPEILLDGWDAGPVRHNIVNGLKWGPDGWLYGRHGIQATSNVGKPGAPANERIRLNCCIWRFHPVRHAFEVVCQGGTNPWGHDWDEFGNLWFINTVIGHLWQGIPGAWFKRMYGEHLTPHRYELIDQHADHYHWNTARSWTDSRDGGQGASALGGGHAHSGLMIYLGDNWPANLRNDVFTLNFHGRRMNHEVLERAGSGYSGRHRPDFIQFADPWFRGIDLAYGPDGGVWIIDWSDRGECHENDVDGVHRETGRIFKVTYGTPALSEARNVAALSNEELVRLQLHPNEWFVRHARRNLQERAALGHDMAASWQELRRLFDSQPEVPRKLRLLWALHASGGASAPWLQSLLENTSEPIRRWSVTLLAEADRVAPVTLSRWTSMAQSDGSPEVRLALASAMQRLPLQDRPRLAEALLTHSEDASDHNLPYLIWYGIEPAISAGVPEAKSLFARSRIPVVRQWIARRLSESLSESPSDTEGMLQWAIAQDREARSDVLVGLSQALRGWRKATAPASWESFVRKIGEDNDAESTKRVQELNLVFGDGRTLADVRQLALNPQADSEARRPALQHLIESRMVDLDAVLERLLTDRGVAGVAARGLAASANPEARSAIFKIFGTLSDEDQAAVVGQLVSRAASAAELLHAMATGKVPRSLLNSLQARQIQRHGDAALGKLLAEVWGEVRASDQDKQESMRRYRRLLTPERLREGDRSHGRALFAKTCAVCHRLYGEGKSVGPDLTGSGRSDLEYLLENVVDPSAMVPADYRVSNVELKDDRSLTGVVVAQNERTIELQMQNERLIIDRADITTMQKGMLSLMPDGLLDALTENEVRDLISYLMHPTQVALP